MKLFNLLILASVAVTNAQSISRNGRCGIQFGSTCLGSTYGSCCSQYNYCGSTAAYCGVGCNPLFGSCSRASSSSARPSSTPSRPASSFSTVASTRTSSATPSSTLRVTTNARCGKDYGWTCQGSQWGNCCSQYGYCGSTNGYCDVSNCQKGFGQCGTLSSSSSSPVRSSTTLSTSVRSSSASSTISSTRISTTVSSISSTVLPSSSSISSSASSDSIISSMLSGSSAISSSVSFVTSSSSSISSVPSSSSATSSSISSSNPSSSDSSSVPSSPTSLPAVSTTSVSSITTTPSSETPTITSASSSTSSFAAPVYTNFCLKVVTPNLSITNQRLSIAGAFLNLLLRPSGSTDYPVGFFNIAPSGRLETVSGLVVVLQAPDDTQILRTYRPTDISDPRSPHPAEFCSITASMTLDCVAHDATRTWPYLKGVDGGDNVLAAKSASDPDWAINIQLGVFYGPDCV